MKTKKIILSLLLGVGLFGSGCTDGFDAINTNPNGLTEDQYDFSMLDLGASLRKGATYEGADAHQRVKALGIDVFVQYTGGTATSAIWSMDDGWQSLYWKNHYNNQISILNGILRDAELYENRENSKALARIWRIYIQSMFTDYFGPAPFPQSSEDTDPEYMKLEDQYAIFFKELDEAVNDFDATKPFLTKEDPIYSGRMTQWKRFANTLRLRLAIKMSEINPTLCKEQAQKAFDAPEGIMQSGDDARIAGTSGWGNQYPYYMYQVAWTDRQMLVASMEKALTGIGGLDYSGTATVAPAKVDPRGSRMFDPSPVGNAWVGIPPGMRTEPGDLRSKSAAMSTIWVIPNDTRKTDIMLYTEACFLMAEAVERFAIVSPKTAKQWYEEGIKASFANWGVSADVDAYIASSEKNLWGTSAKYDDATGAGNTKLEKIVTQRYIAFYPDLSLQVWNDKRRLNIPAMVIPEYRDSGAGIYPLDGNIKNPDNYISRTVYPQSEKQINESKYNGGVAQLRDGDKTSSPLWWASKRSNYVTSN
ncbi:MULTISPECIES: SusD/RagB family nutrient-binding outer membrane lipoprotein [unclassified Dysgonomonas]|uniref:SusD/RagB family nutrient-binding outer membrane lipoprotein n=1 Tax=unclassified Dysgonomonas TaxID=2630389 RepID=UPI0013EC7D97|nr:MULTISPECIES: SusD/RagB family nutrient-binding outer membrane lipoprotein [unclassified Dysgonomonas]